MEHEEYSPEPELSIPSSLFFFFSSFQSFSVHISSDPLMTALIRVVRFVGPMVKVWRSQQSHARSPMDFGAIGSRS